MRTRFQIQLLAGGKTAFFIALVLLALCFPGYSLAKEEPSDIRASYSTVQLDKDSYSRDQDVIFVTVTDSDENKNASESELTEVTVSVWRHEDSEILTLTETGPDTGEFTNEGGLPVSPESSSPNDGHLQADRGHVIEVIYIDDDDPSDQSSDQAIVGGGSFSYTIDEELKPSQAYAADDPSRSIAVAINPGGFRDEYVTNEILVKTDDPAMVDEIVERHNGQVLHDGRLGPPHKATPANRMRPISSEWGYKLIRVDPTTADMTNLEQRMTEYLQGEFVFSSLEALQIGAIVLEQKELRRNVTLSMFTTDDGCPCSSTEEDQGTPGVFDDAFDYDWFSTLDHMGIEYLGVTKAWQFLDGLGIPDDTASLEHIWGESWEPVRLGIIDGGFEANDDWPGGVLPAWCEGYGGSFTEVWTDCGGTSAVLCSGGSPCPWHGTTVYGAAAALSNNQYGAAGTAATCGGPLVEVMLSRCDGTFHSWALNIRAQTRGGADVINRSGSGECNWWCQNFGGAQSLVDAVHEANSQAVLVVAAAGNQGQDLGHNYWWGSRWRVPCEIGGVICVGAIDWACDAANCFEPRSYSNYGGGVSVWAPDGFTIWAPDSTDTVAPFPAIEQAPGGTSIAAPYVAGILAMVKALYPPSNRYNFYGFQDAALLFQDTAWSHLTTAASTSDRVHLHGGVINAYEMVRLQANFALGLGEADVDDNEPNDEPATATPVDLNTTVSGVISSDADPDYFRFETHDHYDVTATLQNETYPGELQITSSISPASGATVGATLAPGEYSLHVEQAAVPTQHPFNCYDLELSGYLSYIAPDVFDDGDTSTPVPGGWPTERNDRLESPSRLTLPPDPMESSTALYYSSLNFDTGHDVDYFQVTLPDDPGPCFCFCGENRCSNKLVITVVSDRRVDVTFLSPDGWEPIYPYMERWEQDVYGARRIEIACPQEAESQYGRPVATENGEVSFYIEPHPSRTDYDLSIEYQYLSDEYCEAPSSWWTPMSFLDWRPMEEPEYNIFPALEGFWDCLSDPGCDPADEYIAVNWAGGDFEMLLQYAHPAKKASFTVSLLNAEGDVLGDAEPVQFPDALAAFSLADSDVQGQLALFVKDLDKGWYFLQIDGPFPTLFASQLSPKDLDKPIEAALEALPETGGVAFPTYALVMAFGGLAILGGLGFKLLRRRLHQGG